MNEQDKMEQFKSKMKAERRKLDPVRKMVYDVFKESEYFDKDEEYFAKHASEIIYNLRERVWNIYRNEENGISSKMYKFLVDEDDVFPKKPLDIIEYYIDKNMEFMYELCLSNTNSRRSRAGNAFECIMEIVLLRAGIYVESQGNIGSKAFSDKNLQKQVDMIVPGIVEFERRKGETIVISLKTSLRERYAEVMEEKNRGVIPLIYLGTMDENIAPDVLENSDTQGVYIFTTKMNKTAHVEKISIELSELNREIDALDKRIKEIEDAENDEAIEEDGDEVDIEVLRDNLKELREQESLKEEYKDRYQNKLKTFEDLIADCSGKGTYWKEYWRDNSYRLEKDKNSITDHLTEQIVKHGGNNRNEGHYKVIEKYYERICELGLKKNLEEEKMDKSAEKKRKRALDIIRKYESHIEENNNN